MAGDSSGIFEELKRRRVFRATAAYVVVAAGVVALAADAFPALELPPWTVKFVVVLAALGLPVTIALSWAFDVRPSDPKEAESEPGPATALWESEAVNERAGSRWTPGRIAVVGAVVILALAGAAMLFGGDEHIDTLEHRVAVLPFENGTGDASLDDLGDVAADWITDGLASVPSVEVIPNSTVKAVLSQSGLGTDPIVAVTEATRAGLVVTGSFVLRGDSLEVRAQVVEAPEGQVLGSVKPSRADPTRPTTALGPLRQHIMGQIATRVDAYGEAGMARDPPGYDAYRYYLAGRDRFFQGEHSEAIELFDRAVAIDSSFLLPRLWTAGVLHQAGDYVRMDSVFRLLEPYRETASAEERLGLDYVEALLRGDLGASYRIAQAMFRRSPSSFTRFQAALQAQRYNHRREAVDLYRQELEQGTAAGHRGYAYANLAGALHGLGEYEEELKLIRQQAERFPANPYSIFREARALAALDRPEEAEAILQQLSTVSPAASSRWLQIQGGLELRRHGYPDAGERIMRRSLAWYLSQDSISLGFIGLYAIARARLYLGEHGEAARLFRTLTESDPDHLGAHGYLGVALAAAGRTAEARELEARLAEWSEPYLHGKDLYWRAAIAARLGDHDRAIALLEDAIAHGYRPSYLHEDEDLRPLWDLPPFQRLIEPKG